MTEMRAEEVVVDVLSDRNARFALITT